MSEKVEPSWNLGSCGHFDSFGDPDHDCSTWDDDEKEALNE